jgi:hypothetical protein
MIASRIVMVALLAAVVVGVGVAAFALSPYLASGSSTTTSHTTQTSTSTTTDISTTTTEFTTSTTASFTYTSSVVKIDSILAFESTSSNGTKYLSFQVTFHNIGPSTVYVAAGCGSPLSSSSGTPSVVGKLGPTMRCLCATQLAPLAPGEGHTSIDPGCWSGYSYVLLKPGSATMHFTLSWGDEMGNGSGSTDMTANFSFA